ncbi:hypothetical protein Pla52nx_000370 [Stieleria varia]|uniref:Uncharacterized protein n=1 Tax=Stieleria varia TaxID=2528005 RepID=A0A5C6B7T4_9BACT|nr:hypothetical protein Pla52n_04430 [Stieleria varia]
MNTWTIVLVSIGIVSIAVSLANLRHSPTNTDLFAVSKSMSDDSIGKRLNERRTRIDAKLGVQFGAAFVFMGLLWQAFLYLFWI